MNEIRMHSSTDNINISLLQYVCTIKLLSFFSPCAYVPGVMEACWGIYIYSNIFVAAVWKMGENKSFFVLRCFVHVVTCKFCLGSQQ